VGRVRHPVPARGPVRPPDRFWLVASFSVNEVCVHPPGFDEDAVAPPDTDTLLRWQAGRPARPGPGPEGGHDEGDRCPLGHPRTGRWGTLNPFSGIQPARAVR